MPLDTGLLEAARSLSTQSAVNEDILGSARDFLKENPASSAPSFISYEPAREYEDEFRAKQVEERLKWARGQLEASPLPAFKAFGVAAGAPIVAGVAR